MTQNDDSSFDRPYPGAGKGGGGCRQAVLLRRHITDLLDGLTEEKTAKFLTMLSDLGHASPIEHASFTFGIEGVSRTLLAQITRHRIASFSVQSQRYVRLDDFRYVVPPEIEAPGGKGGFP